MAARRKSKHARGRSPDDSLLVDVDVKGCDAKGKCRVVKAKGKIDTGAQNSYLPKTVVRKLHPKKIGTAHVRGVTGTTKTAVYGGVTLGFPGRHLRPVSLAKRGVMVYPTNAEHVLISRNAMAGGDDARAAMALNYDAASGRFNLKPSGRGRVGRAEDEELVRDGAESADVPDLDDPLRSALEAVGKARRFTKADVRARMDTGAFQAQLPALLRRGYLGTDTEGLYVTRDGWNWIHGGTRSAPRRREDGAADAEDGAETAGTGKLFARSFERYNGGVKIKRLYGSSTVTRFYVGAEGSDPATWVPIDGYGATPGERATYAKRVYWSTSAHSAVGKPVTAARAAHTRWMADYPLPEDPREIAVGLISGAKVNELEARGLRVQAGPSDPDARDLAAGVLGGRLATLEAGGLGVVEDEPPTLRRPHATHATHATHTTHAAERGYTSIEPIALTTVAAVGLLAAPRLNTAIKQRPLGAYVPPSAGASMLLLVGGGLARRGGYRKTGNASIALGIGMGVGTLLSAKAEGGMLAARG